MAFNASSWAGLKGHAQAYAELAAAEWEDAVAQRQTRLLWAVLAGASGLVACLLGGVALMLWGVLPEPAQGSVNAGVARWLLWATPLPPLALCIGALFRLSRHPPTPAFALLRQHIEADLQLVLPKDDA
jgi:hypothetical protein